MGRRRNGPCVSLPPRPKMPPRRVWTAEEIEADALRYEAMAAEYDRRAAAYARNKARTTPAQRARKAAQGEARTLRKLLQEAAAESRWARVADLLDDFGLKADGAKAKATKLRERIEWRTRRVYQRAADGCDVSASFLADDSLDPLYAEAFAEFPPIPTRSKGTGNAPASG